MSKDKLVWSWGYDGTVLYIFRIYQTKFFKRWKLQQVKYFYTKSFTDVQAIAEDFIKRYEERQA